MVQHASQEPCTRHYQTLRFVHTLVVLSLIREYNKRRKQSQPRPLANLQGATSTYAISPGVHETSYPKLFHVSCEILFTQTSISITELMRSAALGPCLSSSTFDACTSDSGQVGITSSLIHCLFIICLFMPTSTTPQRRHSSTHM
jgi:hypothetical protein